MAEFVQYRTEERIPELQHLQKLRLLEKHEIRAICKRRQDYEYKIQRRSKHKEDYLNYIQYEIDVLKLLRVRWKKLGGKVKGSNVNHSIGRHINKLFREALMRFQGDIRIWTSYVKFCRFMKYKTNIGLMLSDVVRAFSDKPALWKLAATYELEENKSVETAREYLLRGIRCNPTSKMLYVEAFRLELLYADVKQKEIETNESLVDDTGKSDSISKNSTASACHVKSEHTTCTRDQVVSAVSQETVCSKKGDAHLDQVIQGRLAEVIYEAATKKINDITFFIELLDIAKEFDFTYDLRNKIISELLQIFQNDERAWDIFAHRELEGYCTRSISPERVSQDSGVSVDICAADGSCSMNCNTGDIKERIRRCCAVYLAAVKQLPTSEMWSLYIDTLLELNEELVNLPKFTKQLLQRAFHDAHEAGLLKEKYYMQWVSLLSGCNKKLALVLLWATEMFPLNVELWKRRLQFHLHQDEESAMNIFKLAISTLKNNGASLPLWKILIKYWEGKSTTKVEEVFHEGILQGPAVAIVMRPMFIEWLALVKGIAATRQVYNSLCTLPPFCLELHQKMINIECRQSDVNLKQIRKCYDHACKQFGKNNSDIWMDYIKMEQERGDPKNVSVLHWRAMRDLDPVHVDMFVSQFSLAKLSVTKNE